MVHPGADQKITSFTVTEASVAKWKTGCVRAVLGSQHRKRMSSLTLGVFGETSFLDQCHEGRDHLTRLGQDLVVSENRGS